MKLIEFADYPQKNKKFAMRDVLRLSPFVAFSAYNLVVSIIKIKPCLASGTLLTGLVDSLILIILPLFFSYIIETRLEKDAGEESAYLKINMPAWDKTGRFAFIFIFAAVYSFFWWGFLGVLILLKNLFFATHKISAPFYCVNSWSFIIIYLVNLLIVKNRRESYKFMKFLQEKDKKK